jgi:DNA polymerase-3 subunit delta'
MAQVATQIFSQIIGHTQLIQKLRDLARSQRLSSTYLFVGPSGIGKKRVARGLAQALVCESKSAPCGECGPCIRIYKSSSESLLEIAPEATAIKLEQAREIQEFCQLAHHSARIVIIDQADLMNLQTANTLLKLLEEPPPRTHFFLLVPSLQSVLSTIRSRAQVIRFGLLPKEELTQKMNLPAWLVESSGGRMDQIEILQSEDAKELRERAKSWLEKSLAQDMDSLVLELKAKSQSRDDALWLAKFWREFLRDIWFQKQNLSPLIHSDLIWDEKLLQDIQIDRLDDLSVGVNELERGIRGSADVSLALEHFLRSP